MADCQSQLHQATILFYEQLFCSCEHYLIRLLKMIVPVKKIVDFLYILHNNFNNMNLKNDY